HLVRRPKRRLRFGPVRELKNQRQLPRELEKQRLLSRHLLPNARIMMCASICTPPSVKIMSMTRTLDLCAPLCANSANFFINKIIHI
ncbi:hypothetical protein KIN20_010286, partial [Parelaphostrongylus tenuis]